MRLVKISCVSTSPGALAKETMEQKMAPISEQVVARVRRWRRRMVVEGGRKEKMLRRVSGGLLS